MNKFFNSIMQFLDKLRKNKFVVELIFWISSFIVMAFIVVTFITKQKLFLIGSGFGFLGIFFYFILNPEIIKESIKEIKGDKTKSEGISVTLRIIIAVAIVIALLAILNGKLPKIDFTSSKIYSISKDSKQLV
ncbi:MAG: hypothetical protein ACK4YF_02800, partial [Exilispira sp.]